MVPVSWPQIRSIRSSQRAGFEELCCQLAHCELVADAGSFTRKGAPDAGVECFWLLASGDEWGWQAKFFVNGFGDVQWRECDKSVKTALQKHPNLTRLYLCFPYDFPDARIKGQESTLARWNKRVQQWSAWANAVGRTVEFIHWDEHELIHRLSNPMNRGRLWFWFNAPALDHDWFVRAANTAVRQAQERYSPKLHFDLPLAERFDALARNEPFRRQLTAIAVKLAEALHVARKSDLAVHLGTVAASVETQIHNAVTAVSALPRDIRAPIDFTEALAAVRSAQNAGTEAIEQLWTIRQTRVTEFQALHGREPETSELPDPDNASYALREIDATLGKVRKFLTSEYAHLARRGVMMLKGDAGFGKTHLLCFVAERRVAAGRPAVLLLGERFDGSEPWTNALQLLGLTCSRDEFLGALDAAGESAGCRALILIDAINEGEGVSFWNRHLAAMLADVAHFPHVGVAFSIRSPFVHQLGTLPAQSCVAIEHHGFAGQVAAASRHFFQLYGLAEPNVPVLNPEFENPLFLKLVCEALKHHDRPEVPADLRSVTTLFSFILTSVNQRLAASLDFDKTENRVAGAIDRLAQLMAQGGVEYLPVDTVKAELEKIHPSTGYSQSLLRHLITEHLLVRVPKFVGDGKHADFIRFTYQRLSDHLIVRCLLHGKTRAAARGLFRNGDLARFSGEPFFLQEVAGWVEAMAIQLPETHALEIDQITPVGFENDLVSRAFIAGLIWRKPEAFSHATANRIEAFLTESYPVDGTELLEAIVAVTACADHPYNAEWLDARLRPMSMADRDEFWSSYLFGKLKFESSVSRLVEWAWGDRESDSLPDSVVRLAALTLTWCLTTSDRFVRDRATKALVALLERRVHLLLPLLDRFSGVEEPYLQERLFAAAYGCALRASDSLPLRSLAQYVYDRIFRAGNPPASVLLRDHARGIVDLAARRGLVLDFVPERIVPPHKSSWPKAPQTLDRLAVRFRHGKYDEKHRGLSRIYDSVIGDDFSHYVVGDVSWWHQERLNRRSLSPRRAYEELLASLPEEDADTLRLYAEQIAFLFPSSSRPKSEDRLEAQRRRFIADVDQMLGRKRARIFIEKIVPYLKEPRDGDRDRRFDVRLFQRLILQRVLQLGYSSQRFNEIDRHIHSRGREAHKAERIGKKYQWIAYDEFHARISDNFGLADSRTPIMDDGDWRHGTWPTNFRDLDPSLLLRETPRLSFAPSEVTWWTPQVHTEWNAANQPEDWLKRTSDLPPAENFLRGQQSDGSRWILLNNYASWRRSEFTASGAHREHDRYEIHYIVRSYFVRRPHLKKIMDWGQQQNWINDLLPSPDHDFHRHLHEHCETIHFDGSLDDQWIDRTWPDRGLPHPVLPTTSEYMCEHSTYDCSVDDTVIISLPHRALVKMAELKMVGRVGNFVDASGQVVALDPSTCESGHNALAYREDSLRRFLVEHDLALVWTLLGEKNIYSPERVSRWHGRLTILGMYSWTGEKIAGGFRTEFLSGRD